MIENNLAEEIKRRKEKISALLVEAGADAILIADNANIYYTFGKVVNGYTYINSSGKELFFVRRPVSLIDEGVVYIRKPENILNLLEQYGVEIPKVLALELDTVSYNDVNRLKNALKADTVVNGSQIMRMVRSEKSEYEVEMLRASGLKHARVYSRVPKLFQPGMTDLELQIEIERQLRLEGCLGQFRISGQSMEMYMGNLLCGDNADTPTPYDFAMGGAGLDPSLPVGCNGTPIRPGMAVMVDMCGNFTGYMTDMTRTFYYESLPRQAYIAHQLSIDICNRLAELAKPGVAASSLYEVAVEMAKYAGLEEYFMGHRQKAGFIGHGVGIEVNELPVLAPRSKDIITEGNVIALEPKFVIPRVGAVGIENTYVVTSSGLEKLTGAAEQLISLL